MSATSSSSSGSGSALGKRMSTLGAPIRVRSPMRVGPPVPAPLSEPAQAEKENVLTKIQLDTSTSPTKSRRTEASIISMPATATSITSIFHSNRNSSKESDESAVGMSWTAEDGNSEAATAATSVT